MHITFLTRKYPPQKGGMETFSYQLMQHYTDDALLIHHGSKQWHLLWVGPLLLLRGILKRRTTSLYHLGDGVLLPIAPLLKAFTKKPIVVTIHGLELTYKHFLLRFLLNISFSSINAFVCVSHYTANLLAQRGVAQERIHVIGHGVIEPHLLDGFADDAEGRKMLRKKFCDIFQLDAENRPLLITVGRLVKRKGVAWFVENVLPQLKDMNPLYVIISDGPDRAVIETIVREKKLDAFVRLLGKIDETYLQQAYASADIFVMPNRHVQNDVEGFGFVGIEASVYGTPVIASDVDGIPDAIHHGKNGILIATEDAVAYAEQIREWMTHPQQRTAFGKQAQEYTLHTFRWEEVTKRYKELFRSLS